MAAELTRYKSGNLDEVLTYGNTTTRNIDEIGNIILLNDKYLKGKTIEASPYPLVGITTGNVAQFAHPNLTAFIHGNNICIQPTVSLRLNSNNIPFQQKDFGGTLRQLLKLNASNVLEIGSSTNQNEFLQNVVFPSDLGVFGYDSGLNARCIGFVGSDDFVWLGDVSVDTKMRRNVILQNNRVLQGLNTGELVKNLIQINNNNRILVGHSGNYLGFVGSQIGELPQIAADLNIDPTKRIYSGTYGRPFKYYLMSMNGVILTDGIAANLVGVFNYSATISSYFSATADNTTTGRCGLLIPITGLVRTYAGSSTNVGRITQIQAKVQNLGDSTTWAMRVKRIPWNTGSEAEVDYDDYTFTGSTTLQIDTDFSLDDTYLYYIVFTKDSAGSSRLRVDGLTISGFEEL